MTETEWLAGTDPTPLLTFLRRSATDRKLRLFGVGCCRQIQGQANVVGDALGSAERYADTGKTKAELKRARQSVKTVRHAIPSGDKTRHTEWVALWLAEVVASENAFGGVGDEIIRLTTLELIRPDLQRTLTTLIRCVFGNPFRPNAIDPDLLSPAVVSIAQNVYDEHATNRMSELADVLERSGCNDADILTHCRGPGPHVRGCWVVDSILGKR